MNNKTTQKLDKIVQDIILSISDYPITKENQQCPFPSKILIREISDSLLEIIFPGYFSHDYPDPKTLPFYLGDLIIDCEKKLNEQIQIAIKKRNEETDKMEQNEEIIKRSSDICYQLFRSVPLLRKQLVCDIQAAFDGDPAATNKEIVISSYPGIFAIAIYRIAHQLLGLGTPYIPRMMTEYAHSITGIDIHPQAKIGNCFFIDHGTGVVIGETTVIGNYVKLYQGVTLGALSTKGGQDLSGIKRHPTIEDHVVIYSGATVLGGDTVIGKNVTVGGNAFITESIKKPIKITKTKKNTD